VFARDRTSACSQVACYQAVAGRSSGGFRDDAEGLNYKLQLIAIDCTGVVDFARISRRSAFEEKVHVRKSSYPVFMDYFVGGGRSCVLSNVDRLLE
jgi:hypothetical protein